MSSRDTGQGQRYWEWIEHGADCSPFPPPPHCCAPYPLVHPTSIPLQFLSTFCSPLKEIGFKPWHELAPQIDLILPHPGDATRQKKETHFFSSFPLFHFNLFPISSALALYILCPSISYPLLLLPLFCLHPLLWPLSTSSCFSPCVPPCQSAVWATFYLLFQCDGQVPPGSDGVIWWQKRAGVKKNKGQMAVRPSDCIKKREEREGTVCWGIEAKEEGIPFLFISTADRWTTDSFPFLFSFLWHFWGRSHL